LQGDAYGISYIQKFLKDEEYGRGCGNANGPPDITDENFGIPEPLEYKQLIAVKDWRSMFKKRIHRGAQRQKSQIQHLEMNSANQRAKEEEQEFAMY
jgi:hypothetical protein